MRHFTQGRSPFRVRLACVKHAASVQSEPESNSPVQICTKSLLSRNQNLKVLPTRYSLVNEQPPWTSPRREKVLSTFSTRLSTTFFAPAKLFREHSSRRKRESRFYAFDSQLSTVFYFFLIFNLVFIFR